MRKHKRTLFSVSLLLVIAALLGIIIGILPEREAPATNGVEATEDIETTSESIDYTSTIEGVETKPVEPSVTADTLAKPVERKIFLIIDDVGNSLSLLDSQLRIGVPVTFAVMPGRPFSEESVFRIKKAGFDLILHQPMEPEGGQNPGEGAIYTDMDQDEIYKVLDSNLKEFPEIKGINNHMGSKATASKKTMNAVMAYLRKKDMFFLDSVTTRNSVAEETAALNGVAFAKRNVLFLDNEEDKAAVKKAFMAGVEIAANTGSAIMIGHVKTLALAEVIEETYPGLKKAGYTFNGITSLFTDGGEVGGTK